MIDPGLCANCANAKTMTNDRGSTFIRCTHPALPKYPRLPVINCAGFQAA